MNEKLLKRAEALLSEAESLKTTSLSEAEALLKEAQEAQDYQQIMNTMGRHVFCSYGQNQEEELDLYWSAREDISYASHGSGTYTGRRRVYEAYVVEASRERAQARAAALKFYGKEYEPPCGPGCKVMDLLLSPYVEIAKDHRTARGAWMVYEYRSHLDSSSGKPEAGLELLQFSCDFIREAGNWKIWHLSETPVEELKYESPMMPGGPGPDPKGGGAPPPPPNVSHIHYVGLKTLSQKSGSGDPCEPSFQEPAIPAPYEAWSEENSYVAVECDGYDASQYRPK